MSAGFHFPEWNRIPPGYFDRREESPAPRKLTEEERQLVQEWLSARKDATKRKERRHV